MGNSTFVFTDSNGSWRKEYINVASCYFSSDDRIAVFQQGDMLHFLQLGENRADRTIPVRFYQQPQNGSDEWVIYQEEGSVGELVLMNMLNYSERRLGRVDNFLFDRNGTLLLLEKRTASNNDAAVSLQLLQLKDGNMDTIWTGNPGEQPSDYRFSQDGQNLAFMVTDSADKSHAQSIWCYHKGMTKSELKIKDGDPRIDSGLQLSGSVDFSNNGRWLFFTLVSSNPVKLPKSSSDAVQVDVWSYRDRIVQPAQLMQYSGGRFKAVIATEGNSFQQLEKDKDQLVVSSDVTGDVVVLKRQDSAWWADSEHHFLNPYTYYVRSLRDKNKTFPYKVSSMDNLSFSPNGRWLVYYDAVKENYFSYDLESGNLRNLTGGLPRQVSTDYPHEMAHWAAAPLAGWISGDSAVLLYDNFDLWQVDLSGKCQAINVTHGYGLSHRVKLRLAEYRDLRIKESIFSPGDTLLLTGFNIDNKYNGFLQQVLGANRQPELLYMGPNTFFRVSSQKSGHSFDNGMKPLKATKAHCWIVKRQSASEAPNYFLTNDFRHYRPLTQLAPQSEFNWLTAELINYRQLDGTLGQGVLYKPEDFDQTKKYPVVFNYYEEISSRLYEFPTPEPMRANIDIAWFVSRGYLVFTPDIYIRTASISGKTIGQWAYNSVVAAAQYLTKLPYVDKKHIGIQGHSLGGQETNYLVTHTHLFAAAVEMAGVSDEVSSYLSLLRNIDNELEYKEDIYIKEAGQLRFGSTLWQRPDLYLRESAVLYANNVTTPLLIVHNKRDEAVSWRQAVELYMALRRLGKRVWLLQYDGEHHSIDSPLNSQDYTIRVTQFFDYYLKGTLPPKWMTEGIPAKMRGLNSGYELDSSGKVP
jgi:dipeptidyl aminopeptidase/acylaminoacyl peptidase